INVPQGYVTAIATGQEATLTVRNYPDRKFTGLVARSAGALDPQTRTLRYQIDFPNKDGLLFAGMYGQILLKVTQTQSPLVVPSSAVVFDSEGTKVWLVGDDNRLIATKVDVGRDFGTEMEITSGLSGNESVVTNPGNRLLPGATVQLATSPKSP